MLPSRLSTLQWLPQAALQVVCVLKGPPAGPDARLQTSSLSDSRRTAAAAHDLQTLLVSAPTVLAHGPMPRFMLFRLLYSTIGPSRFRLVSISAFVFSSTLPYKRYQNTKRGKRASAAPGALRRFMQAKSRRGWMSLQGLWSGSR